jgi:benzoate membrane transport protein
MSLMFAHLERPSLARATLPQVLRDFGPRFAANGFIGWVFSATAPVAIILSVGSGGGLSEAELAWIFGVFFINGLLTILFCWLYREPLAFAWTIPGKCWSDRRCPICGLRRWSARSTQRVH